MRVKTIKRPGFGLTLNCAVKVAASLQEGLQETRVGKEDKKSNSNPASRRRPRNPPIIGKDGGKSQENRVCQVVKKSNRSRASTEARSLALSRKREP